MYNLCSQHLQNFNFVQQKFFVLQPLKDLFQIRPRRCRQTWIRLAKFPMTLLLSSLGSDGCCDGCLEVRDGLEVVLIHHFLEVTSHIEVWGV